MIEITFFLIVLIICIVLIIYLICIVPRKMYGLVRSGINFAGQLYNGGRVRKSVKQGAEEFLFPKNISKDVKDVWKVLKGNTNNEQILKDLERHFQITKMNYFDKQKFCLSLQEYFQIMAYKNLWKRNINVKKLDNNKISMELNATDNCEMELNNDVMAQFSVVNKENMYIEARFRELKEINEEKNEIILECEKRFKNLFDDVIDNKLNVYFYRDRSPLKQARETLQLLKDANCNDLLHPECKNIPLEKESPFQSIYSRFFEKLKFPLNFNDKQKCAVKSILKGTSSMAPYIICGGAGTGKTQTLIEAVKQILLDELKTPHILITASTNNSCDEIFKKLIEVVPMESIFRYKSKHAEQSSNGKIDYRRKRHEEEDKICKSKVVIATLGLSVKIRQMKIENSPFTHVFIDDCGTLTEMEALGAVAGTITDKNGVHGQLILVGDPKQMGPNCFGIKTHLCEKLGISQSFLERLLLRDLYKCDTDNLYKTDLAKNYRSHPSILKISNELFYDNRLQFAAPLGKTDVCYLNAPVVFHKVQGKAQRKSFKKNEIDLVMKYLEELTHLPNVQLNQIGIIAFGRIQASKIKNLCKTRNLNVEIGSVPEFLGREKQIIIISTGGYDSPSFHKNGKMFNTAITRAQNLLIVLGDEETLKRDKNWNSVIESYRCNQSIF